MGDDGYSPSVWDSADHSDPSNPGHTPYGLFQPGNLSLLHESATTPAFMSTPGKPSSPPPRSSSDSLGRSSTSRRRDSVPFTVDRKDTLSTIPSDVASLVEPSFDENVLRALCELDVGDIAFALEPLYVDTWTLAVWCASATGSNQTEHGILPGLWSCFPYPSSV